MALDELVLAPFNQVLGTAFTNVPAYSNTDDETFSIGRHYLHGIFMGIKWQCVEYARRWLLLRKGCVFKNVRHAADIWTQLTSVERVTDGEHFPLKAHPNGSPTMPNAGSFLIYCRCEEQPVGHIAVICEVGSDYVRIAEQNNKFHYWEGGYARQLSMICKDGLYFIEDEDPIYGWMEIEDNNQLKPLDELDINAIHSDYQQSPPMGKIERHTVPQKQEGTNGDWLDENNPAENFFIQRYGKDPQQINLSSGHLPYYKINSDFLLNVGESSNELHRMFLEATNRVIHDDELLTRFGISEIFWNRIRQSWANDQDLTITGRFDFAFNGTQLKVLEYNADTSTRLFECAIIQKKWPAAINLPSAFAPSWRLNSALINSWKRLKLTSKVHLFIDDNEDERQMALYMQNLMKEAGIESKLCVGTGHLHWKDKIIVDSDGEAIQFVWKSWMWDAVFEDYLAATKEPALNNADSSKHPRISDVLLNDQIKVVEPLWKVITSNKALLPLLCQMYPNHPLLLRSEWNLTDDLKSMPYVKKPMVGRHGQNITIYGPNGEFVIAAREGHFSNRDSIYQEMFSQKSDHGYQHIISSWIIRGLYAGLCVHEDQNLITNDNSPMIPCCIVWEEEK